MHIMVGTDGSDDAVEAARRALTVLATPDTVTLICVAEPPPQASAGLESGFAGGVATPEELQRAHAAADAEARAALERTAGALPAGPAVELRVEAGDPGPVLVRLARDLGVDVVVVGTRGRGAVKRMLLGSVSTHVAKHAPCPVVVVGPGTD